MINNLNEVEIRILGSLIEKKLATPEYYPLSLNGLLNACNQKSNRNPVVKYGEDILLGGISSLKEKKLASQSNLGRVSKYNETFISDSNILNKGAAVICILLLRGDQTGGEIKTRTERLCNFTDLEDVFKTIEELRELGFIIQLTRQPGQKEVRYCQLFGKIEEANNDIINSNEKVVIEPNVENDKILALENEIKVLNEKFDNLRDEFRDFKNQF